MENTMTYQDGYNLLLGLRRLFIGKKFPGFLFILHLLRRRLIKVPDNHLIQDYYTLVEQAVSRCNDTERPILDSLLDTLASTLHHSPDKSSGDGPSLLINKIITTIDDEWYDKHYSKCFDKLSINSYLYRWYDIQRSSQPREITRLMCALPQKGHKRIYNPFAGDCSFIDGLPDNINFIAQEKNRTLWAIGTLRLLAHDINPNHFLCEDPLLHWKASNPDQTEGCSEFDLIIASPLFFVPIPEGFGSECEPYCSDSTLEDYLFFRGHFGLSKEGQLIGLFSLPTLSKEGNSEYFRSEIINGDLLDKVILLPPNLFKSTSISTAILVFSKKKKRPGFVTMIDGTSFTMKKGSKSINILDWEKLLMAIRENTSNYTTLISNSDIAKNRFSFHPSRYINISQKAVDVAEGFVLRRLGDLVEPCQESSIKLGEELVKLVRGKDLADGRFAFDKTFDNLKFEEVRPGCYCLSKDYILVNTIRNLKPTFFHYSPDYKVIATKNICALETKNNAIYLPYLINELGKDYVSEQVTRHLSSSEVPSIKKRDLINLEVLFPIDLNLKEQRILYENDKHKYAILKENEYGLEELTKKLKMEFIEEVRIKKHNLSNYLEQINSGVSSIETFIQSAHLESEIISPNLNLSLAEHITSLLDSIQKMHDALDTLTEEHIFHENEAKPLNIHKLLQQFTSNNLYQIEYTFDKETINLKNDSVYIAKKDFNEMIQQILSNASRHGFTQGGHNIIRFRLSYESETKMYSIVISNNGKPMPKGMDTKRYGIKGESAGNTANDGLGGYRVKSIAEQFKGNISVVNDPISEFPVSIIIKLPKYYGNA